LTLHWEIEEMDTANEKISSPELEALQKLQETGETMVFNIEIETLLTFASQRAQALGQLKRAEQAFQQAISEVSQRTDPQANDNIFEVERLLEVALTGLRGVNYPQGQQFEPRYQVLQGDITRAEALQQTIQRWKVARDQQKATEAALAKWEEFKKEVTNFYQHLSKRELEEAQAFLTITTESALQDKWPLPWQDAADAIRLQMQHAFDEANQMQAWETFSQYLRDFDLAIAKLPTELSLQEAQRQLDQAKTHYKVWPVPSYKTQFSLWRDGAGDILKQMEDRLKEARQGYLEVYLEEANQWLVQADNYLHRDPFAALACLYRAKVLLKELQNDGLSFEVWSNLGKDVKDTFFHLERVQKEARQVLPEWLSEQQRNKLQDLQKSLNSAWEHFRHSRDVEDVTGFLTENKTRREQVDEIGFYLYQLPTIEPDPWLQKLILTRQGNLLRARQLLIEVRACWPAREQLCPRHYIYWIWQQLETAIADDPDNLEIDTRHQQIEKSWQELERKFKTIINQVDEYISKIEELPSLEQQQSPKDYIQQASQALVQANALLKEQIKHPPAWNLRIEEMNSRLKPLQELYQQAEEIKEQWYNAKVEWRELVQKTRDFLDTPDLPAMIKHFVMEAVRKNRPDYRVSLFDVLEYQSLIVKQQPSNI
jgi:hypothetical protein